MQTTYNSNDIYIKYKEKIREYQEIISKTAGNVADFILKQSELAHYGIVSMFDIFDNIKNINQEAELAIFGLYNIVCLNGHEVKEVIGNSMLRAEEFQTFAIRETINAFKECHDCHNHELDNMHGKFEQLDISQHHEM